MRRVAITGLLAVFLVTVFLVTAAVAAEQDGGVRQVKLFDAINQGVVEATLTPNNSLSGSVMFKNKTDEPVEVLLPAAYSALPINAQYGGYGGGMGGNMGGGMGGYGGGMGGMSGGGYGGGMGGMGGGGMQGMGGGFGGGMGGMGGGMGGMGGGYGNSGGGYGNSGGGYGNSGGGSRNSGGSSRNSGGSSRNSGGYGFNVAPDRVASVTLRPNGVVRQNVRTVCLEHGKSEPHSGVRYTLAPVEKLSENPEVHALCELLGDPSVNSGPAQGAIQAAAWHLNNHMSWGELAAKTASATPRQVIPWFNARQIVLAQTMVTQTRDVVQTYEREQRNRQSSSTYESQGEK